MAPREEKTAFAIQLKRPKRRLDIPDAKRRRVLPRKKGKPRVLQNAVIHLFLQTISKEHPTP
jgi:hypothetical protein